MSSQNLSPGKTIKSTSLRGLQVLLVFCMFLLLSLTLQGCNVGIILGYLIGGPPSIEPEFDAKTNLSMTERGVKVAVICYAPPELKWDFDEIDSDIMKSVSARLSEHSIKLIDPERVQVWLDEHPDWDKPQELGKDLEATYVIYIDLNKYSLHEKGDGNLFRGRANATVSVFEMDEDGDGEKIFTSNIKSQFPHAVPRSTHDISYSKFKKAYLLHLSDFIGRRFYEYYNGDDFDDAT